MKKLALQDLAVESFDTSPAGAERPGTVRAHDSLLTAQPSCPNLTCAADCSGQPVATCDTSCMTAPCAYTFQPHCNTDQTDCSPCP